MTFLSCHVFGRQILVIFPLTLVVFSTIDDPSV
jgi:hypothetical protein